VADAVVTPHAASSRPLSIAVDAVLIRDGARNGRDDAPSRCCIDAVTVTIVRADARGAPQ